ncbi:MAG: ClcB-like voltage-gated chloride channel protein [Verrucomicrobia bacterium]|nr:ClcB-like voltage-gated chloride channel protein [Verrucomicrobiota bacterium]
MSATLVPTPDENDESAAPLATAASRAGDSRQARLRLLLRIRVWLAERIRFSDLQVNLIFAGVVGLMGGFASVAFRIAARWFTGALTLHWPVTEETLAELPDWYRLLVPVLGALAAGFCLWWGSRVGRSGTSTDYMEAITLGDGVLPFRYSLVKSLSALCTIASGGSIGREGPVVALSAMLASLFGRRMHWPTPRLRMLVACGAAAGLAAVQNAPIAGAFFVAEIILGQIVMESFGPLVFASVVATQTVRNFLGESPVYDIPAFRLNSNFEMVPYIGLGLLLGLVGAYYLQLLRVSEKIFARSGIPIWARLAIGGAVVGALGLLSPAVYGNGFAAINALFHQQMLWRGVLLILVVKLLATAATFGSGAVGGVFTPTMFVGAFLGYFVGIALRWLAPGMQFDPLAFALVGMGAFLAAATQAPLMSILVLFELTRDYLIILPLMLACVVSYYVCRGAAGGASIYSESLKRKAAREGQSEPDWSRTLVGDLMRLNPPAVTTDAGFKKIAESFITTRFNYLYVTDQKQHFEGAISLHDVKPYLSDAALADIIIARDVLRDDFPRVGPHDTLRKALATFTHHDGERLPVISDDGEGAIGAGSGLPGDEGDEEGEASGRLLGSISKTDLILAISAAGSKTPAQENPAAANASHLPESGQVK